MADKWEESEILEEAVARWGTCDDYYSELYSDAIDDWRFTHGEGQWDQEAENARTKDGRPCLTLNQCLPYAHQITNDIKQARLAIRVIPADSKSSIETADIKAGIIRNIEKQSKAKMVYGTAAMNAIGAGIGWMRIDIDYADNDTFEQEATINRVLDFTACMLDPTDTSLDGSKSNYGFDSSELSYSREKFEELYPDKEPVSFKGLKSTSNQEEEVSLTRYYYKEFKKKTIYKVKVEGVTAVLNEDDIKILDDNSVLYEKLTSREIDDYTIYHCILSGANVLSREEFPSRFIPLIPVIGKEFYNNGKREFHSLIRQGKDGQKSYNYLKSENVQIMALQPKAPYIGAVGQFRTRANEWASANNKNYSTLEYDMVVDERTGQLAPPPQRAQPPQGSQTIMAEANEARNDIRLALGMSSANMGERSNIVSGIALKTNQLEGDNATFHFIDNLSSSIAQVGRVLNDLISVLYSERKIARIVGEDDVEENVPVNTPYVETDNGKREANDGEEIKGIFDLSSGKYSISMDVGASYSSKRQETADKLTELYKADPSLLAITGDLAIEAMDLPMAKEIAERIRSQMDPAILGDDPMAAKLQASAQALKQMEEQLLNMEAALADKAKDVEFEHRAKAEELQMKRDKLDMNIRKTNADINKIRSETAENIAETEAQKLENAARIQQLTDQVMDIGQTVELLLNDIEENIEEGDVVTSSPQEEELEQPIKGGNDDS